MEAISKAEKAKVDKKDAEKAGATTEKKAENYDHRQRQLEKGSTTMFVCGHQITVDENGICSRVSNNLNQAETSRLNFLAGTTFDLADDNL